MEAKLKDKQAAEATVEVTVPAAEVDAAYDRVLGQLARQVRVPGFRPGKAPKGVLIKRIGQEALEEEVREHLVERSYPQAIEQFELTPVHAHIHGGKPSQGEDFTFDLHIDLYPEVKLPPLDEIVIDSEGEQVTDDMVAQTVERLQNDHATLVPVEREVRPGDQILVESVASEEEQGGDSLSAMPIDLDQVGDELAEQLVGKSLGDVVELKLGPESEADGEESNETAPPTLRVKITDVKEKEKPEPDDEFAKTLGFESWSETEDRIRRSLQAQLDRQAFEEQREEFVDKLMESTEFELPNSLVQRRKAGLLENLSDDLKRRGMSLEQYVAQLDEKDGREEFEKELQEAAEKGVKRDMLLEQLLEERGTRLSDTEFEASLRELANQQGTDPQRLSQERGEEWLRNYRFLLTRDRALNEAVRERLVASGKAPDEPQDGKPEQEAEAAEQDQESQASPDAQAEATDSQAAASGSEQTSTEAPAADGDPGEAETEGAEERR